MQLGTLTLPDTPEAASVIARLSALVDPATIPGWLDTPNPAFDGMKPLWFFEAGTLRPLERMLDQVEAMSAT